MSTKQWSMTTLFEQFIRDSERGRRLKKDGKRIRPQTVDNYRYVLLLLQEFEKSKLIFINIKEISPKNKQQWTAAFKYWNKFYLQFTDFLYNEKGCFDNYTGSVIKIVRVFFAYLKTDKLLQTGDFYKQFYVCKEDIPVHTLLPQQLSFLINDQAFHLLLTPALRTTKAIFILGCTVALRFSDLIGIRACDMEQVNNGYYLSVRSIKTDIPTKIKLPQYAVDILKEFSRHSSNKKKLLPSISKSQFNKNIRQIALQAGWTQEMARTRTRRGKTIVVKKDKQDYRFCDHLSSHTMRRTAITTMLMLGMPEHIVRKISGHSANSKSFYRYVNLVQAYLDIQTDKVFDALAATV